jgi:hypothetical protein
MRESIIAIVIFPFILLALAGFYVLIGIFIALSVAYSGVTVAYEWLRELDWGFDGVNVKRNK